MNISLYIPGYYFLVIIFMGLLPEFLNPPIKKLENVSQSERLQSISLKFSLRRIFTGFEMGKIFTFWRKSGNFTHLETGKNSICLISKLFLWLFLLRFYQSIGSSFSGSFWWHSIKKNKKLSGVNRINMPKIKKYQGLEGKWRRAFFILVSIVWSSIKVQLTMFSYDSISFLRARRCFFV